MTKKVPNRAPVRRKRTGRRVALILAALVALGVGAMHLNARTVHVRYATVRLDDLPAAFDGTRILFATDIDVCGTNTPADMAKLFSNLASLQPDILLLGGDYASAPIFSRLNEKTSADEFEARKAFFDGLASFSAPMGKYAITGDGDGDPDSLMLSMINSGVELIDGGLKILDRGGEQIGIVGIGATTPGVSQFASKIDSQKCVITLMHSPERYTEVSISEAGNGGPWTDLVLAGHTHGGQVQIAGRSALSLTESERRFMSGWHTGSAPLLVSSGVGCEGLNLRLGSQAEVWLIKLKCK